jgi:hypothetical protein
VQGMDTSPCCVPKQHQHPRLLPKGGILARHAHLQHSGQLPQSPDASRPAWTHHTPCVLSQRSGIGSQIHVLGLVLAVAMDLDRILLLDTDVHDALFTDDEYCGTSS